MAVWVLHFPVILIPGNQCNCLNFPVTHSQGHKYVCMPGNLLSGPAFLCTIYQCAIGIRISPLFTGRNASGGGALVFHATESAFNLIKATGKLA